MNVTQTVSQQIERMKPGKLFSYQDISSYAEHSDAVVKAISRNSQKLGLVKIKKGLFYKSEVGRFGPMAPKSSDVIHYFTSNKQRTVGYVTGPALYYQWGLTTQIPAEVNIARSIVKREKAELSGLRIITTPSRYKKVSKNNIQVLQFLDVLKNIDRIPDAEIEEVASKLALRLKSLSSDKIKEMENIAVEAYTERTKALLGSFLETYLDYFSEKLHKSLNPTSKYSFSYLDKWKNAGSHWHLTCNKK
ncbi:DUF6088 family protein [Algibacillus agarilyticus]|uniref:DUF6088 family protein n=1 Tax=Algibacillus agarilyticus TaxID=2234133 RepID=UPI000DD03961|nr:DUF6088 family protein [Algibacillus agarilyticus]